MNSLTDLFPKAKAEIFRLLFAQADQENHLRDLARLAELSPAALQKNSPRLPQKNLCSPVAMATVYTTEPIQPTLYPELHGMALKTSGIAAALNQALADIQGIDTALIFGSVAAGSANSQSDIDVLVLGHIGLRKLAPALRKASESLGREINPVCFTPEEWQQKLAKGDALAQRITIEPKLMLKGVIDAAAAMAK